ncbi:MAG: alpha-N-acetylglucosaminidase C-terminal domain-containing protein [Clostridia bacterium]|nr:alpha-N-acetylglucosaminidase C-terminal domain-containing protein [Clostridia bacterium]
MINNLIKRYSPMIADRFSIKTIPAVDNHNVYEIEAVDGLIQLSGDSNISLAMAYYRYMKDYCGVCMTHCGNYSFNVENAPLPDKKIIEIILQDKRIALTPSMQSNTACFWDWDRWEREIDFMAMRGINMPYISVGVQAVIYYSLLEMNINEDLALAAISAPTYFDKQQSGCISGYMPSPSVEYIEQSKILGKKIFDREVSYGMTPILQGYWGHVPYIFGASTGNKLLHSKEWYGFTRTYFLKPWENAFEAYGRIFLDKQRKLLGESCYYSFDSFCEHEIPSAKSKYINNLAKVVDRLHSEISDSYTLITRPSINHKLLSEFSKNNILLIIEENEDVIPGYSYVLGNKAHLADRTVIEGSLKKLAEFSYSDEVTKKPGLCGLALTSEGYAQNPMYYDLAFDMMTAQKDVMLDDFISSYASRRWGSDYKEVAKILSETCYGDYDIPHLGSAVAARPAVLLNHTAPYDIVTTPYDNKKLLRAVEILIKNEIESDAYLYDVCDILRQVLSNLSLDTFDKAIERYKKHDADLYEKHSNNFLEILSDLNRLLLTRPEFSLKARVDSARALAKTDEEKNFYEVIALSQISIYGHIDKAQLYDYAWKELGGFIDSYYAVRWRKFFELLAENFFRLKHVPEKTKKQLNGRNTFNDDYFYVDMAKYERTWITQEEAVATSDEDTLTVARELIEKYCEQINS